MENVRKFLPLIVGGFVAAFVFFVSRSMQKSSRYSNERNSILEKAREAKLAKSLLEKSENENSENTTNS